MAHLIQAVLLLTGIVMIAAPRSLTRKDDRNDIEAVKRTKTLGYWVFFAGLIWVISAFLMK